MKEELSKIKKYYGEEMMHFCRSNFSTILNKQGILLALLEETFAHDKNLITDLSDNELTAIEHIIFDKYYNRKTVSELKEVGKSVEELLLEKGYDFYECHTYQDTLKFKKYYQSNEELCTFKDQTRTSNFFVTFAVKKDAHKIKRKDIPQREDDYGTSVLSIQIKKDTGRVSIKSRYNHTVDNPDATFFNDLEKINVGLTKAFEKKYNIKINKSDSVNSLGNFTLANDGKFYRFNLQNGLLYFCHNNILIYDTEINYDYADMGRYLFVDDFIFDLRKNASEDRLVHLDKNKYPSYEDGDYFREIHKNVDHIEIHQNNNNPSQKFVILKNDSMDSPTILTIDNCGNLISYVNPNVTAIEDFFLYSSRKIKHISMNNVKSVASDFCLVATRIKSIEMNSLKYVDDNFAVNSNIPIVSFPSLLKVGDCFMTSTGDKELIYLPKLIKTGSDFFEYTHYVKKLVMDSCKKLEDRAFNNVKTIDYLSMNSLEQIGNFAFVDLENIGSFSLPKLHYISPVSIKNYDLVVKIMDSKLTSFERFKKNMQKWYN